MLLGVHRKHAIKIEACSVRARCILQLNILEILVKGDHDFAIFTQFYAVLGTKSDQVSMGQFAIQKGKRRSRHAVSGLDRQARGALYLGDLPTDDFDIVRRRRRHR